MLLKVKGGNMDAISDLLGFIFNMLWTGLIVYLIVKAWNGFWHCLFPNE
jgi:hypothetical protein